MRASRQHQLNSDGKPAPSSGHGPTTQLICAAAAMAGGITLALAIAASKSAWNRPGLFVFFTLAMTVFQALPLRLQHGDETETLQLEEAFFVPMALLLSPLEAILGVGLAVGLSQIWERRPAPKALFNVGQIVTAAGLGLLVTRVLGVESGRVNGHDITAGFLGGAVFALGSAVIVSAVIASAQRRRFLAVLRSWSTVRSTIVLGSLSLGVMVTMATARDVFALPALIAPVALISVLMPNLTGRDEPRAA